MRKISVLLFVVVLFSCKSSSVSDAKKPLYEVLTQQTTGGASIRFFEILTEANEIKMLQNDDNLKNKIKSEDIKTSNFIILNMGEQTSGGYSISVTNVEETSDRIIVTVKEKTPEPGAMTTSVMTTPYAIVKINSKKQIVVK